MVVIGSVPGLYPCRLGQRLKGRSGTFPGDSAFCGTENTLTRLESDGALSITSGPSTLSIDLCHFNCVWLILRSANVLFLSPLICANLASSTHARQTNRVRPDVWRVSVTVFMTAQFFRWLNGPICTRRRVSKRLLICRRRKYRYHRCRCCHQLHLHIINNDILRHV